MRQGAWNRLVGERNHYPHVMFLCELVNRLLQEFPCFSITRLFHAEVACRFEGHFRPFASIVEPIESDALIDKVNLGQISRMEFYEFVIGFLFFCRKDPILYLRDLDALPLR
jgi:hypothetical protein